jgi:hypothetical protein
MKERPVKRALWPLASDIFESGFIFRHRVVAFFETRRGRRLFVVLQ